MQALSAEFTGHRCKLSSLMSIKGVKQTKRNFCFATDDAVQRIIFQILTVLHQLWPFNLRQMSGCEEPCSDKKRAGYHLRTQIICVKRWGIWRGCEACSWRQRPWRMIGERDGSWGSSTHTKMLLGLLKHFGYWSFFAWNFLTSPHLVALLFIYFF